MAKEKSKFVCCECGYESPRFLGKCPNCGEWNSLVETIIPKVSKQALGRAGVLFSEGETKPVKLSEVTSKETVRLKTGIGELDQILGGGLVQGQAILLAGEPGAGKSTLLLQLADKLLKMPELKDPSGTHFSGSVAKILSSKTNVKGLDLLALQNGSLQTSSVLYASGEESIEQIGFRAKRLGVSGESNIVLFTETNAESVINEITKQLPNFVIIDSIQTMWTEELTGTAGSVGQVRECTRKLIGIAKRLKIPLVIVGHVTKEGAVAGPKVLEHLVDTVLYFEGERYEKIRILRISKNRFGPTDEAGVFLLEEDGFKEVLNPSEMFFEKREKDMPGLAPTVVLVGTRPLLVEIQALVSYSELKSPRRIGSGVSFNRLVMICAILSKHLRVPLEKFDVYVNVQGGLRIEEPAADLAIAVAIYSSLKNIPVSKKACFLGELSLLGEIRAVQSIKKRISEAKKLGFSKIYSKENGNLLKELLSVLS